MTVLPVLVCYGQRPDRLRDVPCKVTQRPPLLSPRSRQVPYARDGADRGGAQPHNCGPELAGIAKGRERQCCKTLIDLAGSSWDFAVREAVAEIPNGAHNDLGFKMPPLEPLREGAQPFSGSSAAGYSIRFCSAGNGLFRLRASRHVPTRATSYTTCTSKRSRRTTNVAAYLQQFPGVKWDKWG
jgi:hypothetical protein